MKFKELFDNVTWSQIEKSLIRIYKITSYNLKDYMSVVQKLSSMSSKESNMKICIDWIPPDDELVDNGYWDVYGRNGTLHKDTEDAEFFSNVGEKFMNSQVTYALEFNKWEE